MDAIEKKHHLRKNILKITIKLKAPHPLLSLLQRYLASRVFLNWLIFSFSKFLYDVKQRQFEQIVVEFFF